MYFPLCSPKAKTYKDFTRRLTFQNVDEKFDFCKEKGTEFIPFCATKFIKGGVGGLKENDVNGHGGKGV